MSQTILRGVIREGEDIDKSIVSFLRDQQLSSGIAELLGTFNSTVVKYAPTLEEITLQDIIVAYQDGKLSEGQMHSIEGFIDFASQFLEIRLGVTSSVEKETSIAVFDLNQSERGLIQEVLQERFSGMKVSDFLGTFNGTKQSTDRDIIEFSALDLKQESGNTVQDGIRDFIEKIKSNIFAKRNPAEKLKIEKTEESKNDVDDYIEMLLDIETPLDKALLKTIPLDLTFEEQREVITRLIKRIFPDISETINMDFLANSLDVFPNIGGKNGKRTNQSRGFKFGRSISESYLKQILEQNPEGKTNDKFMTTALRRIIVSLRFLNIKSRADQRFIQGEDSSITVLPQKRLETVLSEIGLEGKKNQSDLQSLTQLFVSVSQTERREMLKRLTAKIVGTSYEKIDFTHIDYIIEKYVRSISEYNKTFSSSISQLLKEDSFVSVPQEKAREILYALSCLRKIKELDTNAEIAYRGDIVESEDELVVYEEAHTADAEQESQRISQAETDSSIERSESDELDFFTLLCSEFESNEQQYEQDISTVLDDFSEFEDTQKMFVLRVLGVKTSGNTGEHSDQLRGFLYRKYLENADMCTKMTHLYHALMKAKKGLDESVKQRDLDRILNGFNELNSQDQNRFLDEIGVLYENRNDLSDILKEKVFGKESNSRGTKLNSFASLQEYFESKTTGILKGGTISKKDKGLFLKMFELASDDKKARILEQAFKQVNEGARIGYRRLNTQIGKTISENEKRNLNDIFSNYLDDNYRLSNNSALDLIILLYVKGL